MTIKWVGRLGFNRRAPTHDPRRFPLGGEGAGLTRADAVTRAHVRASTAPSPPCDTYTVSRRRARITAAQIHYQIVDTKQRGVPV